MPIIDHNDATEVPWRPNYRKWLITEEGDGTTAVDASVREYFLPKIPSCVPSFWKAARQRLTRSTQLDYSNTFSMCSRAGVSDSTGIGVMLPPGGCHKILNMVDLLSVSATYSTRTG